MLIMVSVLTLTSSCSGPDKTCYSPTVNASSARSEGAQGCACDPAVDRDVCTELGAMVCGSGHWVLGIDGPCMPVPDGGASPGDAENREDVPDAPTSCSLDGASSCPVGTACNPEQGCLACFTPTLNTDRIALASNQGCPCDATVDRDVCVHGTGLMCMSGRCMPVPDGGASPGDAENREDVPDAPTSCSLDGASSCPVGTACNPEQGCLACFTPTLNTDLAIMGSSQGCPCDRLVDHDVCAQTNTGSKALVCYSSQWQFVLDGPCMPMPQPDANTKIDTHPAADASTRCPNDSACPGEVGGTSG